MEDCEYYIHDTYIEPNYAGTWDWLMGTSAAQAAGLVSTDKLTHVVARALEAADTIADAVKNAAETVVNAVKDLKPENDCSLPSEVLASDIKPTSSIDILDNPLQDSSDESPVIEITDVPSIEPQTDQIETVDNPTS